MKKLTISLLLIIITIGANAQIFSDDFESYTVGSYLGPQSTEWTTWSGTEGGAEDVQISSTQASSGTNSIYFNGNGGQQNKVVLDFGTQYTNGILTFQADFLIDSSKYAYINFQGSSMNCYFKDGLISFYKQYTSFSSEEMASGSYIPGAWLTLIVEANISSGIWRASVNGNCLGVWSTTSNSVSDVNFFTFNSNYEFYVDNVSYDWVAYNLFNINAAVSDIDMRGKLTGMTTYPTVLLSNPGASIINSCDLTLNYNGIPYTENLTGLNLNPTQDYEVSFTTPVPLVAGLNTVYVTVSNINGGPDDDPSDDEACSEIDIITPATGKVVVTEEAFGTWCGWCPRGTVYMDKAETEYDAYFAGITVHQGDPMESSEYSTPFQSQITSYPRVLVDRGPELDPFTLSTDFLTRIQIAPDAFITNGAIWNPATRELQVSISADFQVSGINQYKMLCVLTEDSVTGTTNGYALGNFYAGGANGPMGGFAFLPNPVPAAQMVYDRVARAIAPDFDGHNECFPPSYNAGEVIVQNYVFTLPAEWDETKVNIVGILTELNGVINNADKTTIAEAVANGWVPSCTASTGELLPDQLDDVLNIYPNPATTHASISINLKNEANVQMTLKDINGKVIAYSDYGVIGSSTVDLNTAALSSGIYLVELIVNDQISTKRLVIK